MAVFTEYQGRFRPIQLAEMARKRLKKLDLCICGCYHFSLIIRRSGRMAVNVAIAGFIAADGDGV